MPLFIPLSKLAKQLNLSPRTVHAWTSRGARGRVLKSYKIGGRRVTTEEDLRRFAVPTESTAQPSAQSSRKAAFLAAHKGGVN